MSDVGVVVATFLTAGVEWVEAFTIVLAVSLTIGWSRAMIAAFAALVVLAVLTLLGAGVITSLGDAVYIQFIVGLFLTLFGIRWLGKAIARGAGLKPLHDEIAAFTKLSRSKNLSETRSAMLVAFQGVLLEGLEVWVIVVALGVQTGHTTAAAIAALVALVAVAAAGFMLRAPLAKVPENTIKFLVGCAILGFGSFWLLASLGYDWPIGDYALPCLMMFYAIGGLVLIRSFAGKSLPHVT
jgi:uncharacterized membrane protein